MQTSLRYKTSLRRIGSRPCGCFGHKPERGEPIRLSLNGNAALCAVPRCHMSNMARSDKKDRPLAFPTVRRTNHEKVVGKRRRKNRARDERMFFVRERSRAFLWKRRSKGAGECFFLQKKNEAKRTLLRRGRMALVSGKIPDSVDFFRGAEVV